LTTLRRTSGTKPFIAKFKSLQTAWQNKNMKRKNIILTTAFGALSLLSAQLYGQTPYKPGEHQIAQRDSLNTADSLYRVSENERQAIKAKDESTLAEYRDDRDQTKAKAREAQRVENEASAAAKESRSALRSEKKAQRARRDADRQAERASKARIRSDRN
jgi:hypothetical protein